MTTGSYFGLIGMSMTMTMFCRQNGTGSLAEKCLIIVDVIPMSSAQFVEIAYLRSQRFSFSQFLCALVLENCTITIFLFSFSLKASLDQVPSIQSSCLQQHKQWVTRETGYLEVKANQLLQLDFI